MGEMGEGFHPQEKEGVRDEACGCIAATGNASKDMTRFLPSAQPSKYCSSPTTSTSDPSS
uniref:Uncharacterized protein n=1 Tax=Romanomermis culicivorax TaxID=13658 RepID=A0A915I860_ROMCU